MLQLIQGIFLSDALIFAVLFIAFLLFTGWALVGEHELTGYALGWLLGIFFMIIYASVAYDPNGVVPPPSLEEVRLGFFQVVFGSLFGISFGIGTMVLIRHNENSKARQSLKVAIITALSLIVIFFMFVSGPIERRTIGIFALAFGIGTLFTAVLYHPKTTRPSRTNTQSMSALSAPPDNHQPKASNRLNQIREQMRRDE